jgi:hypothetical protein
MDQDKPYCQKCFARNVTNLFEVCSRFAGERDLDENALRLLLLFILKQNKDVKY